MHKMMHHLSLRTPDRRPMWRSGISLKCKSPIPRFGLNHVLSTYTVSNFLIFLSFPYISLHCTVAKSLNSLKIRRRPVRHREDNREAPPRALEDLAEFIGSTTPGGNA